MAGRPGDRWVGLRKKAGREESPDTVVFSAAKLRTEVRGERLREAKGQRAW